MSETFFCESVSSHWEEMMENFVIKKVSSFFIFGKKLFFVSFFQEEKTIFFSFKFQTSIDFVSRLPRKELVVFINAQCKLCMNEVTEIRILDSFIPNTLKRVHTLYSSLNGVGVCRQACGVFEQHLTQVYIFWLNFKNQIQNSKNSFEHLVFQGSVFFTFQWHGR